MNYKEFKKYVDKMNKGIVDKLKDSEEELAFYTNLVVRFNEICEENTELKKQLKYCYCNRTDCSGRIKDSKKCDSLVQKVEKQQQEFINYLEDEIKTLEKDILETVDDMDIYMKQVKSLIIEEILQKYKSIIGDDK